MWWEKTKRIIYSPPLELLIAFLVLSLLAWDHLHSTSNTSSAEGESSLYWMIMFSWIITLIFLISRGVLEYKKRTYSLEFISKYQEDFNALGKERDWAARYLLKEKNTNSDDLEEILDLFEDLGFYLKGDQLSSDVIHHHFFHWIRLYNQAANNYIDECRRNESAKWEHLQPLWNSIAHIESVKQKCSIAQLRLSDAEIEKQLKQELLSN